MMVAMASVGFAGHCVSFPRWVDTVALREVLLQMRTSLLHPSRAGRVRCAPCHDHAPSPKTCHDQATVMHALSIPLLIRWVAPQEDDEHPELGLTDFFDRNARALSYCGDGKTVFCLQSHKSSREGPVLMAIWEDQNACTRGTPGLAQIFNMTPDEWAEITVFNTGKVYFTPDDVSPHPHLCGQARHGSSLAFLSWSQVKHSPLPSPGTSKFVITGL